MAVFSGSSRQGGRNADGSFKINCHICGKYISDSQIAIGKVTCELCARALNGEPVPVEAIEMYNAGKLGRRDVTMLRVEDDVHVGGERFTFRSLAGAIAHAVGFSKIEEKPLESVKASRGKARKRLFADVDLEQTSMGSIIDVDSALEAGKDKQ